jgi:hypothetical protein
MNDLLNGIPTPLLIVLVTTLAIAGGIGLLLIVRRRFPPETLESHNDVAGFLFAVLGVVYAVLLAFIVVGVWDQYKDARTNTEEEAARLLVAFHGADQVEGGVAVQEAIRAYTIAVIKDDWPASRHGVLSDEASAAMEHITETIGALPDTSGNDSLWVSEIMRAVHDAALDRAERADATRTALPGVLWLAVILGAIITIAYSALYGVRNLAGHVAMTAALAGIIGLTVAVVLVLDAPYRADSAIRPEAFELALERMVD